MPISVRRVSLLMTSRDGGLKSSHRSSPLDETIKPRGMMDVRLCSQNVGRTWRIEGMAMPSWQVRVEFVNPDSMAQVKWAPL